VISDFYSTSHFLNNVDFFLLQLVTEMPDVISVTPNRKFTAHTTRSWDFLGVDYNSKDNALLQKGNYGEDVIIGVLDSGYIFN
jgi:hypothetical protein